MVNPDASQNENSAANKHHSDTLRIVGDFNKPAMQASFKYVE